MIEKPIMILPDKFSNFDSLLAVSNDIRLLKYLPVKSNEDRENYHKLDRNVLIEEVKQSLLNGFKLGSKIEKGITITENKYPYFLPHDVHQDILWISNDIKVDFFKLMYIITIYALDIGIKPTELIFFERDRDRDSDVPLIKGTIPEIRHIHIWSKKN